MDQDVIRDSIASLVAYLGEHPEKWRNADPPATAVMIDGLRCSAEGPGGASIVSDMPRAVGGGDSAPRPGWFMRAALATGAMAGRGRSPHALLHRFPFLCADPVVLAAGTLSRNIRSALPK
jgi:hypothetical protein